MRHALLLLLLAAPLAGCIGAEGPAEDRGEQDRMPSADPTNLPVVVGVIDTAINPYHEVFFRPGATAHPCETWESLPCDLPALELSVGQGLTFEEAIEADAEVWDTAGRIPGIGFLKRRSFRWWTASASRAACWPTKTRA